MRRRWIRSLAVTLLSGLTLSAMPTAARADHRPQLQRRDWLSVLNFYRATAGVAPVVEDDSLSRGARLHSRYVVMNQHLTHYERPGLPGYTSEGAAAGSNGNVTGWSSSGGGYSVSERSMIEEWMAAPFHAEGLIRGHLKRVGFGTYRDDSKSMFMAATLDILRGLDGQPRRKSILWPKHGAQVPLDRYTGNELPDPLRYCKGYSAPTGLPLVIIPGRSSKILSHSFAGAGSSLAHCTFKRNGSIFLIPKAPLKEATTYTAKVRTNRETLKWSFTVGEVQPPTGMSLARFGRFFQDDIRFDASWDAADRQSGISHFSVDVRTSRKGAPFENWDAWLSSATERTETFTGVPGDTYCFRARAWDAAGNHSRMSKERCTALPLGALDLTPSLLWFPSTSADHYQGFAYSTVAPQQTLTIEDVSAKRLALVATVCSGCGSVDITFDGEKLGSVDLDAQETKSRQMIPVATFGDVRRGDVVITTTSSFAEVIIEGLAISRL